MKLEKSIYNKGDLLYWNDIWNGTFGIGLFICYINDFGIRDIPLSQSYDNKKWVSILTIEKDMLEVKVFPQTDVCLQNKFENFNLLNTNLDFT
jgi:hypothetical protein